MANLNDDVEKLRSEIDRAITLGQLNEKLSRLRGKTSRLFIEALRVDEHPLHDRMQALGALSDSLRDPADESTLAPSRAVWIAPRPGSSNNKLREHWPLQLLMLITVLNKNFASQLEAYTDAPVEILRKEAKDIARSTIAEWSPQQYAMRIRDALSELHNPFADEVASQLRFEGDTLHVPNKKSIRFKKDQLTIMTVMWNDPSHRFTREELNGLGVGYPRQRIFDINQKLKKKQPRPCMIMWDADVKGWFLQID